MQDDRPARSGESPWADTIGNVCYSCHHRGGTMSVTRLWILVGAVAMAMPGAALAKKSGGGSHGQAPNARAVGELMGKFKWGMTPDDVVKVIGDQLHAK